MNKISKVKKSILVIFFPLVVFGQKNEEENAYYTWFDGVVGIEHTGLYNGKQYVDLNVNKIYDNKHPFFLYNKEILGSITYDGQTYYDTALKYNLEKDKLIVALKSGTTVTIIELINDKIDEFTIEGFRFIRIKELVGNKTSMNKFYEILVEKPSLLVLKKHKKVRTKNIQASRIVNYKFISSDSYFLLVDQNIKEIASKADIIKIYPKLKKEINSFYKINKRLRKFEPDRFMQRLFEKIYQSALSKNES